ncbi:cilia- and flagella-associated protein 157 [Labeo rohita]|uniref:cilia- and flagella-associated protein 157 n=1 Tax=Labeo rohita TaxID=84645 RepID=UPI0021E24186|nr:cilia- and flagella-associated protein 157 [Labeo rohita]XP_050990138.1 cilia- and flagella-associated protein 157 [Labeo rohita]
MEKSRFSDGSLPCGLNSNPTMQTKAGGDHVVDSKSQATTNLLDIVRLKEDSLNKKENKAVKEEAIRKCPFEAYLEKCTRLEKENLEVKKKLKKMEAYSRECTAELQKFVKRFKEFKNINKDLDTKNKQLLIKNQQMRQRITEVLKLDRPQSEDLERVSNCEDQDKQQLRENLTEPVRKSNGMKQDSEIPEERKILTLQQENQTLRERLDHSSQALKDAQSKAERVQEELDELECCLLTVQTERNILRQEIKRLHKEYISLTNIISMQLKENNTAAGLRGLLGKPRRRHNIADKGSI